MHYQIAFVGGGNMAQAMLSGLLQVGSLRKMFSSSTPMSSSCSVCRKPMAYKLLTRQKGISMAWT